jgi:hypothetical protein
MAPSRLTYAWHFTPPFLVACPRATGGMINRTWHDTLKQDHDMILSLLYLDLVFYFSLGITETRDFIHSHPFNNFPNDDPHLEAWRGRSCDTPWKTATRTIMHAAAGALHMLLPSRYKNYWKLAQSQWKNTFFISLWPTEAFRWKLVNFHRLYVADNKNARKL